MTNEELAEKIDKLYKWALKVNERLEALETKKSNLQSTTWTKEEEEYLLEATNNVKTFRPVLLELEQNWQKLFQKTRSYDALRKKLNRLKK